MPRTAGRPGPHVLCTCLHRALIGRDDPRPTIEAIADSAWREGGFLLSNCHGVMHTVGRTYARDVGLTLATLMEYLPRSNDPAAAPGFAHGLVTGLRLESTRGDLGAAATVCEDAGTRISDTAASTGSGTPSCASTGPARAGAHFSAEPSGRRRRPTAPRARTTTTGSRPSAPTARGCRSAPRPTRGPSAPPSRAPSFARAGTAPSSTTVPPASRLRRRTISMRSAAGSRASSVKRA